MQTSWGPLFSLPQNEQWFVCLSSQSVEGREGLERSSRIVGLRAEAKDPRKGELQASGKEKNSKLEAGWN